VADALPDPQLPPLPLPNTGYGHDHVPRNIHPSRARCCDFWAQEGHIGPGGAGGRQSWVPPSLHPPPHPQKPCHALQTRTPRTLLQRPPACAHPSHAPCHVPITEISGEGLAVSYVYLPYLGMQAKVCAIGIRVLCWPALKLVLRWAPVLDEEVSKALPRCCVDPIAPAPRSAAQCLRHGGYSLLLLYVPFMLRRSCQR
jgi:hypothetical protein